ncbi:MAG TPA: lipoyl(octanoyl) transferase LipB [Candidatus Baltobacteraceae bacterium]|jgi:lipoate-protein ligase B|nr:lipoyl(octanoyl) transferase LipB [Candidatus Baltobacteraceae bacterium]
MNAQLLDLGLEPYRQTWERQHALHEAVRCAEAPETWIFVEHPPVITMGRKADERNVLLSRDALAARGVDVVQIERGGDVTYHGPGQLVVYPIRRLERFREVVPLVRALEGAVIEVCTQFGIQAERWSEHAGVWVGRNQICAVGLAVQKMTSLHGIALNVSTELSYDGLINPCGLAERGITSISRETHRRVEVAAVKPRMARAIEQVFNISFDRGAHMAMTA